jgi:CDP-diacylglycerol---serine O-phosphatidyltransferase
MQGLMTPAAKRKRARERYNERLKTRFSKPLPRVVVPSFFTLMNLFCGFLAIIQISEGQLHYGAWLIVLAGLFDALDGFMARITNSTSSFGIELDSLSDVVSFGVAPGYLLYAFGLQELHLSGYILAALPPVCGAIRLARFNVDAKTETTDYFKGLPIPVQAIMVVGFFLTFRNSPELFESFRFGLNSVLIPMVVVLSLLMVSTVPFDKIPRFERGKIRQSRNKILLFFTYFLVIMVLQEWGLIIAFSVFILKGLITFSVFYLKELFSDEYEHPGRI